MINAAAVNELAINELTIPVYVEVNLQAITGFLTIGILIAAIHQVEFVYANLQAINQLVEFTFADLIAIPSAEDGFVYAVLTAPVSGKIAISNTRIVDVLENTLL